MPVKKLVGAAVLCGWAVAVIPWLVPNGPQASLDAASFLETGHFLAACGVVFLGGLLTALTPCVYPLIPITVGVLGGGLRGDRRRSVVPTIAYVAGMALVFSALGVVAARTGQAFGSILGSPAVAIALAVFLFALASSMFGAFELAIPEPLARRLSRLGGGGAGGAFLMGGVAGFLAAPCTGPVLTGLLTFVARSQSIGLGAGLLFVYALGIGAPFLVIGLSALRLPKAGPWMEWVKSVLGIVLCALAASYLKDGLTSIRRPIASLADELGRTPGTWLAALLCAAGIVAGAVHRSFKAGTKDAVWKGLGVALVTLGLLVRSGALSARERGNLWVTLGWLEGAHGGIHWIGYPAAQANAVASFDRIIDQARVEHRPVMIDFYADWCAACKELDRQTYVAPAVIERASRFTAIKVDGTVEDEPILELYQRFGVRGLPTVAFIDSEGRVLDRPRVTGFMPPEGLAAMLDWIR